MKKRYRRILLFAALALLQTWWFELVLPKFGFRKFVATRRMARYQKLARRFSNLAANLGGLIIKAGQFASSRLDVLPSAITAELESLQDEVAPEPFEKIQRQIESETAMPLSLAFQSFDPAPIAAASLGQVHRGTLSTEMASELGFAEVIVKVLRPGIEEVVLVDLKALRKVGHWLSHIKLVSRRTDAPALVEEFAQVSLQEIDYLHEASNLERFRECFENDPTVATPDVVWERSSKRVLVLSNVSDIKINDVDTLILAGIDPNLVAAELARLTFEQIFVHGFFHADPHPGNLFVSKTVDSFKITFIDFGMMGEVTEDLKQNLQTFLIALVTRDSRACVSAMQKLRVLLPSVDTVELESAISAMFDRFGGVGVAEIVSTDVREFRELAIRFSELIRTLPFQLPENFLMLFRSISLISGVTSSLNRDFNMWDAVDPFAKTLLNGGANGTLRAAGREIGSWAATIYQLPRRIESVLNRLDQGNLSLRLPEVEKRVSRLDGSTRRVSSSVIFLALLIGGIILRVQGDWLGVPLMFTAVPFGIHAIGLFRLP
ncbi:MAG: ABC1 kinase family protein [Micrococcales bacterium]